MCWIGCVLAALVGPFSAPATLAHDLDFTYTVVVLKPDGTYQIDVTCDLDALALGLSQGTDSAQVAAMMRALSPAERERRIRRLRETLEERIAITFNDARARPAVSLPEYGTPATETALVPTVLGLTARFTGPVPAGSRRFSIQLARSLPPLYLTIVDRINGREAQQVLARGDASAPYALGATADPAASRLAVATQYLRLGFWHIVPEGADHMLFVLGLFLLSARWRPLLWQVSAFTAAHTLTLALSSYGIVRLPPSVVEPLIALSIAYVAIENLFVRDLSPWRSAVVFLFGLLHGLGFAGVLGRLGLPSGEFLTGLLSFNLGVELGQLSVLAGAFLVIGWLRHESWYRSRVTVPFSIGIAVVGLWWFVGRLATVGSWQ